MHRSALGFEAVLSPARTRCAALAALIATAAALSAGAGAAHGVVVFGQLDDFEAGTTMGWAHGFPSPNPPTNVVTGGPQGTDDNYLQNISTGGAGAGSRHAMLNRAQWAGDFGTAGVTRITGFMANFGPNALAMRVAVQGGLGSWFGSTNAIALPANSGWQPVTFDLTPSAMSLIVGGDELSVVLANVAEFRILSAAAAPEFRGDVITATLGIDDLRAMRLPGDANFDGAVNLADFNALAANFGAQSGATWQQGDFNFNGAVNLEDFNLLAANFGQQIAGPGVSPDDWAALSAVVPEPAATGVALAAVALLTRRRRIR